MKKWDSTVAFNDTCYFIQVSVDIREIIAYARTEETAISLLCLQYLITSALQMLIANACILIRSYRRDWMRKNKVVKWEESIWMCLCVRAHLNDSGKSVRGILDALGQGSKNLILEQCCLSHSSLHIPVAKRLKRWRRTPTKRSNINCIGARNWSLYI